MPLPAGKPPPAQCSRNKAVLDSHSPFPSRFLQAFPVGSLELAPVAYRIATERHAAASAEAMKRPVAW